MTNKNNEGNPVSDIAIARAAKLEPIQLIGERLGIPQEHLLPYGHDKAKIRNEFIRSLEGRDEGSLILVTAMSPTPAGEGKTTTSVGLGDALNRIGKRTITCLREPSLGPCFGMKGGAAGGGQAQVVPMEDINLHFTGDFHAISVANNLLSAMIDNQLQWDNPEGIDPRRITWRRVVDMNDRSLRDILIGLGGTPNGIPREAGFDITVASEVMAILCLSQSYEELSQRLGNIIVGYTHEGQPVHARDIKAEGAMTAILKDAFLPNLVQTLENNPAFIHGGPFANIAHGCNSVIATKTALKLADYVVTEAGFGADLGAEKFFNIKCRKAGLSPKVAVMVATVRALKMHGGVAKGALEKENLDAVVKGCENLGRHIRNMGQFGVPVVVALNHFDTDTEAEQQAVIDYCKQFNVRCLLSTHWRDGGEGAEALAQAVVGIVEANAAQFRTLYNDGMTLWEKARHIARTLYDADDLIADKKVRAQFSALQEAGFGHFPVCMAKTQYSFSTDPQLMGAPSHHVVPVREVRLAAGAEFIVVVCGDIMTMPGLPRRPAAEDIYLNADGQIEGLF